MTENSELNLKDSERQPCEIWTRVMGYHRPVDAFNIGKKQEFADRKYIDNSKLESFGEGQKEAKEVCVA